jgi:hypothetical protein
LHRASANGLSVLRRDQNPANEIVNLAFGLLLDAIIVAVALAFGLGGTSPPVNWGDGLS